MVPVKGSLSLKSNKTAPPVNKAPEGGQECKIITTLAHHLDLLYPLGKILKESIDDDLDINPEIMNPKEGTRRFKNTPRYCSLRELVLRYMDILNINNKRWFYRPISAYKTGHITKVKQSKK